ncbi:adenylate/guanylate cyclase domain-containing protein [Labrenzia sp. R4_2]|uniref:adenylate/guanylate cyclase domain-containing protein n=1 Tax=Labrenzia sp. R4_2 TaxID=2821107 RepID=UPI001ADCCF8E|nr:adenylate/guanylate cyclase domain-containing protein [Labrenzia sp. R4_2]MBO9420616.1 adenylate/guanylate cyclase domain-containing protein [Labrenzia sp. R4_2]
MDKEKRPAKDISAPDNASPTLSQHGGPMHSRRGRKPFRIPVGVALGLVFSLLLVAICGLIIAYMAAADRRIAGRLLDQQAAAILNANQAVLDKFFSEQDVLLRTIAVHAAAMQRHLNDDDLEAYKKLLPENAEFELGRSVMDDAPADELPDVAWSAFEWREGQAEAVKTAELDLGNGQSLFVHYPRAVFLDVARDMTWDNRQQVFLLSGRNNVIVVHGLEGVDYSASPETPLPSLTEMTETPLHLIWDAGRQAHMIDGQISGRLFPAFGGFYTAIYMELDTGPADGWIIGTLYRADQFGEALDQTQVVLYAALAALLAGAALSFIVGRKLGRPLGRLAEAAADLRKLEFHEEHRLPSSPLAELNDVNQAFNGSIGALNAFAKYVPRQLVTRLIEEGMTDSRNIELREMTIVFTDLAGFTSLASNLSAEETAAYLNGYFETVSKVIADRDGTIDKFLGDGVMAFWGAPSDQPDHASKAIAAVTALAEQIEKDSALNMRLRIGIHTGKVVVGDIGSASRMNYTVIGDAVNVAARLQEYGKHVDPGAKVIALASGDTMAQLPEGVKATSLGPIKLRGREEALTVFRIA